MPEGTQIPEGPVLITDKRQQRREEAEAKKLAAELSEIVHTEELADGAESTDEAMARVDRIQELRDKWQSAGSLEEEEQAELMRLQGEQAEAEGTSDDVIRARTAFLVVVYHDGTAKATSDVNTMLEIEREASTDDMYAGVSIVKRDIDAAITSRHVVFGLNVSAQAMQEKAMAIRQAEMLQGRSPAHRRR